MPEKEKTEVVPMRVNPDLKQIYVNGALGGFTDREFRLIFYNETLDPKGELIDKVNVVREINYEIIMSPVTVNELHKWLGKHIEEFKSNIEEFEKSKEESEEDK